MKEAIKQQEIVNRFVCLYATGNVPPSHTEHDVVLGMASLIFKDKATNPGDLIWDEKDYSDEEGDCIFSVEGETCMATDPPTSDDSGTTTSATKVEIATVFAITDDIVDLTTGGNIKFETQEAKKERESKNPKATRLEEHVDLLSEMTARFLVEYSQGTLKTFIQSCATVVTKFSVSRGHNRVFLSMVRTLNFLALTMLRRTVKNSAQMTTAFLKEQYKNNVATLVPSQISSDYAPPTKRCIDKLAFITKAEPSIRSFIAKLVRLWVDYADTETKMTAVIGASLLTHTAWHGMGIVHLLFEICAYYSISWKSVMKETLITTTMVTWKEIFTFCKTYQAQSKVDPTVAWARIVDDSYFMGLSTIRHIPLSALFAVPIIHIQGDEGIYMSKWATDYRHEVEHYHEASEWLHKKLSGLDNTVKAATVEASKLASLVNQPPTMRPKTPPQTTFKETQLTAADFA